MKKFIGEFKKFISRGNVLDMAVGMVVGAAFTAIVKSFVSDILTPLTSIFTGGFDFSYLKLVLVHATETRPEVAITYGMFIQAVLNFLITSFVVFLFVKTSNKIKDAIDRETEEEQKPAEPAPVPVDEKLVLMQEIRDLLKNQNNA